MNWGVRACVQVVALCEPPVDVMLLYGMASPLFTKENKNTNDIFKMADFKVANEMETIITRYAWDLLHLI